MDSIIKTPIVHFPQDIGGNYYQPMLHYVYEKEYEGPFHTRREVHLPYPAEITAEKYSNMRYADRAPADYEMGRFLTKAYKNHYNDVNSATGGV